MLKIEIGDIDKFEYDKKMAKIGGKTKRVRLLKEIKLRMMVMILSFLYMILPACI